MIDTHCHIDDPQYAKDLSAFLDQQKADGVEAMYVPGVDASSVKDVLEVCDRYPDYLFPALGLHPENVKEDWKEQLQVLKNQQKLLYLMLQIKSMRIRNSKKTNK